MFSVQDSERHSVLKFPISKKIVRITSDLCTFCQASQETLEHFFYQCPYLIEFWTKFENVWLRITKEQIKLDYNNIILGILDQKFSLLNYFIILGKLYLWKCRKNNLIPLFYLLKK